MRHIILFLGLMLSVSFIINGTAFACSKPVTVNGTLRMVGSEPMTELILETKDKNVYAIIGDKKQELSGRQGYEVTVSGRLVKPTGIAAKKAINVEKYEIKNP